MDIILLGAPGAGKGTQAHRIMESFGMVQIATGDMLRDHKRRKTEFGLEAAVHFDKGNFVPDDLIIKMIEDRLKQDDVKEGVLFDGFPRTIPQAIALDALYERLGRKIDRVIRLRATVEIVVRRICGRWVCPDCGAPFHEEMHQPTEKGICDNCGGELFNRVDDNEETVRRRIEVYRQLTEPLVGYYEKKGMLTVVDGVQPVADVTDSIFEVLNPLRIQK
jgi:adenylate kinase